MTDAESVDPPEAADVQYRELLEQLRQLRRSVADIATSRKQIELHIIGGTAASGPAPHAARESS